MDWTTSHPTATGTLKSCVQGGECFTVDATAKAGRLLSDGANGYYRKLKLISGRTRSRCVCRRRTANGLVARRGEVLVVADRLRPIAEPRPSGLLRERLEDLVALVDHSRRVA